MFTFFVAQQNIENAFRDEGLPLADLIAEFKDSKLWLTLSTELFTFS